MDKAQLAALHSKKVKDAIIMLGKEPTRPESFRTDLAERGGRMVSIVKFEGIMVSKVESWIGPKGEFNSSCETF